MQDRPAPLDVFVGRTAEPARMAEVIARVEAGRPWLVAVEGDPGVGKTALVRRGLAGAAGLRVLQARARKASGPVPGDGRLRDLAVRGPAVPAPNHGDVTSRWS